MNSLDRLMIALNDHVHATNRKPLQDATFLGTLQLETHRTLIEAALDQEGKSRAVIQALAEMGAAFDRGSDRVVDALRLISQLREALLDQRKPSQLVKDTIAKWLREEDPEGRKAAQRRRATGKPEEPDDAPRDGGWMA